MTDSGSQAITNDLSSLSKKVDFLLAATTLCDRTPHAPELAQAVVPILSALDSELSGLMQRPDGMRVANNYYRELQKFMDMRRRKLQIPDAPDCPEVDGKLIAARQETMAATQAYLDQGGYELTALSRLAASDEEAAMIPSGIIWVSGITLGVVPLIFSPLAGGTSTGAISLGIVAGSIPTIACMAGNQICKLHNQNKFRDFRALLDKYGHGKKGSRLALEVAIVRHELASMSFENLVPLITLPKSFAAQLTRYFQAEEPPHRSVASLMQRAVPAPAPAIAA